jgi:hypothetical protein
VDILLLESLIPEAMAWLEARHRVEYLPALVTDERALRHSTDRVRAMVVPNHLLINADFLNFAPRLAILIWRPAKHAASRYCRHAAPTYGPMQNF